MPDIIAQAITTSRLDLHPLRQDHADEMAAILADPQLYAFTGGTPPTAAELRSRYGRWLAGSPDPATSWCNWVIGLRSAAGLVGTVQATIATGQATTAEVAWIVGLRWQGQGIATEAARALMVWLQRQSVRVVIAHIHPDHHASASVARAIGLAPTDQMQDGEIRWEARLNGH
jgi:RimJ/RimL family protein N-acetyltransferase